MEAAERIKILHNTETKNETDTLSVSELACNGVGEFMRRRKKRHYCSESSESELESCCRLPPEIEEGKFEYKLELVAPSSTRFEHLVTQMKWRLQEGAGEAIYEIGVEDCGIFIGLGPKALESSMETLRRMADRLAASLTVLRETTLEEDRKVVEVLVRKVPDDQQFLDLRIAVLGNADCGKSTLVGVLAHGELDNGRGRARLNLFRHRHEIQSGHTSSISQEIIGFDSNGELQNYSDNTTAEDVCEKSTKIIHFIDVPGHQKYLKTTIFGLMGHSPHFAMLVMSANTGIVGTTREQLGFALCLQVPIFVVVTKGDCCRPAILQKNLSNLESLLKSPGSNKVPCRIGSESDAVNAATKLQSDRIVPIFQVSSKTGSGLELLQKFLNMLPPTASSRELDRLSAQEDLLFQIDDVFSDVPDVGLVTSGIVKRGCIKKDERLLAGPLEDGTFTEVTVTSMHRNRFPCKLVKAGQAAGIALAPLDAVGYQLIMRKGMVLTSMHFKPEVCRQFQAEINLLFHENSIKKGFQCTVHVGNVCQTAEILSMSTGSLKTNGRANVSFKFLKQAECVFSKSKLLFRQGTTRGIGTVTSVTPLDTNVCLR
ncbi:GTP-binding protein 2-like [Watersipora subatra]|uniref:GTP-binding protein 2-like n=1 Tax=Watersipora subatra TaxID=2589382 RepID=UPI00355BC7A4